MKPYSCQLCNEKIFQYLDLYEKRLHTVNERVFKKVQLYCNSQSYWFSIPKYSLQSFIHTNKTEIYSTDKDYKLITSVDFFSPIPTSEDEAISLINRFLKLNSLF